MRLDLAQALVSRTIQKLIIVPGYITRKTYRIRNGMGWNRNRNYVPRHRLGGLCEFADRKQIRDMHHETHPASQIERTRYIKPKLVRSTAWYFRTHHRWVCVSNSNAMMALFAVCRVSECSLPSWPEATNVPGNGGVGVCGEFVGCLSNAKITQCLFDGCVDGVVGAIRSVWVSGCGSSTFSNKLSQSSIKHLTGPKGRL